jgi:microcystin degradation protein MlrC
MPSESNREKWLDRSPCRLGLREEMLELIRRAGPVDGVCLVLHGAMLVERIGSGETDQVRAVRALLGDTRSRPG